MPQHPQRRYVVYVVLLDGQVVDAVRAFDLVEADHADFASVGGEVVAGAQVAGFDPILLCITEQTMVSCRIDRFLLAALHGFDDQLADLAAATVDGVEYHPTAARFDSRAGLDLLDQALAFDPHFLKINGHVNVTTNPSVLRFEPTLGYQRLHVHIVDHAIGFTRFMQHGYQTPVGRNHFRIECLIGNAAIGQTSQNAITWTIACPLGSGVAETLDIATEASTGCDAAVDGSAPNHDCQYPLGAAERMRKLDRRIPNAMTAVENRLFFPRCLPDRVDGESCFVWFIVDIVFTF